MTAETTPQEIAKRVRIRLGPDATTEMIETIVRRVITLIDENDAGDSETATRWILTATGPDIPDIAAGLFDTLRAKACHIVNADRATVDGYCSWLVSIDVASCTETPDDLAATLLAAGEAEGLLVTLERLPGNRLAAEGSAS